MSRKLDEVVQCVTNALDQLLPHDPDLPRLEAADLVADKLEKAGIVGIPKNARSCPVTAYLNETCDLGNPYTSGEPFFLYTWGSTVEIDVRNEAGDSVGSRPIRPGGYNSIESWALLEFVGKFDREQYPALIHKFGGGKVITAQE